MIVTGMISDAYGRKKAYLFNCLAYILGVGLTCGSRNVTMFCFGRLFTGFGGWANMLCAVTYGSEISTPKRRGVFGGGFGCSLTLGYVIAGWTTVGMYYSTSVFAWRAPLLIQLLFPLLIVAGLPFVPESPRWLALKGRDDEVLEVEDDLDHVLLDARHRVELVRDAVDPDARDRGARDRREQGATERVAEGVSESGLERLDDEPRTELGDGLLGEGGALRDEHVGSFRPSVRHMTLAVGLSPEVAGSGGSVLSSCEVRVSPCEPPVGPIAGSTIGAGVAAPARRRRRPQLWRALRRGGASAVGSRCAPAASHR
ncbi:MAG: hypothetical protein DI537_59595 [Stutzerimonas stutzeri]|nr:MAG: hypothetical protein DI537_59595 [Stutzerimonas stutzeri]